ncbi:hypothetical protein K1719_027781 [Acacia pycnantha]|nr:hypothetical protein K1719_027781 [Acacia pycnantha]
MATKFEHSCNCITCCLPTDIMVEIAAKVASQSIADLYHLKLTSKQMMNITEDDYVYKHASLDKVPFLPYPETIPQGQVSFLSRCRSSGNLESLYREGMEVFLWPNKLLYNKGLDTIRMAAQKGHKRSMYAFAMTVVARPNITTEYQSSFVKEALGYIGSWGINSEDDDEKVQDV